MYSKENVVAVIVIYYPDGILVENLKSLESQVAQIVIVNNSYEVNLEHLIHEFNLVEIKNNENEGVAKALNQGLSYASLLGYELMLSLDQDTILKENAVQEMIKILNYDNAVVSVGASYEYIKKKLKSDINKSYLITSGNIFLVNRALFVGGFSNYLFIDSVDFDFSLRMRDKNYKLILSKNAKMDHKIGYLNVKKFLHFEFYFYDHSPERNYYIFRNHILIVRKYFVKFPMFCIKKTVSLFFQCTKILFIERDKLKKIQNIVKGIHDGYLIDLEKIWEI